MNLDLNYFSYPWSQQDWIKVFNGPSHYYIDYIFENEIIKSFILCQTSSEDKVVHLLKIITKPIDQRQGLARKLLRSLITWCELNYKDSIYLEVHSQNHKAISFYKSFGFNSLRNIKSFYSDGSDALVMQLKLNA